LATASFIAAILLGSFHCLTNYIKNGKQITNVLILIPSSVMLTMFRNRENSMYMEFLPTFLIEKTGFGFLVYHL